MKQYLGDSAHADFDGYHIVRYHVVLAAGNGPDPRNTIALEPSVLESLNRYAEWLDKQPTTGEQNDS